MASQNRLRFVATALTSAGRAAIIGAVLTWTVALVIFAASPTPAESVAQTAAQQAWDNAHPRTREAERDALRAYLAMTHPAPAEDANEVATDLVLTSRMVFKIQAVFTVAVFVVLMFLTLPMPRKRELAA